ncbi:hypothetical protein C8R43DRAFT_335935 [Mycena crocata]|nr:hypothetical protein C8R43DRAFT_335935 [Mycena crocata]
MTFIPLRPLSNRDPQQQYQTALIQDNQGCLRFSTIIRSILALPPELLSEIFVHCLPDDAFVTPNSWTAPLLLCGICRHFREVALATPHLWSSLYLNLDIANGSVDHVHFCRSWLSRACTTPLSLSLYDGEGRPPSDSLCSLFQTIAALSSQWRTLVIDIASSSAQLLLFEDDEFPMLEKLEITWLWDPPNPISFSYAPHLRELSVPYSADLPNIRMHWDQLTTFRSCQILPSDCLQILCDATHLVVAEFQSEAYWELQWTEEDVNDLSGLPTTIPPAIHIQSLMLRMPSRSIIAVLHHLKTPALKILELDFILPGHDGTISFLSFMSRSAFQLHTLTLSNISATTTTFIQCLKATRSLAYLRFTPPCGIGDVNPILASFAGDRDFLPKLEALHLDFQHPEHVQDISASLLVRMLSWRWDAGEVARLRSFQFVHPDAALHQEIDNHSAIPRLKEEGMLVYVGTKMLPTNLFPF